MFRFPLDIFQFSLLFTWVFVPSLLITSICFIKFQKSAYTKKNSSSSHLRGFHPFQQYSIKTKMKTRKIFLPLEFEQDLRMFFNNLFFFLLLLTWFSSNLFLSNRTSLYLYTSKWWFPSSLTYYSFKHHILGICKRFDEENARKRKGFCCCFWPALLGKGRVTRIPPLNWSLAMFSSIPTCILIFLYR